MTRPHDRLPVLTVKMAAELLQCHSFSIEDADTDPRAQSGFMSSLRPYTGTLNHAAFHEVMACLKALAPELSKGKKVDRQVISDLWSICHLGRTWAVDADGMLQRNHLIRDDDMKTLEEWLHCISDAVMWILETGDLDVAFAEYDEYVDRTKSK